MNDDQLLLASAYIDGDVDETERARAEADADVMAEVARMRGVRETLRDTEPPDPARRERALAAALAALADGPAHLPPPSPPVPLARRPRRAWWGGIAAAAAALVLVVGGGIALRGTNGGGDDDAASFATAEDRQDVSSATGGAAAPAPGAEATDATEDGSNGEDSGSPAATAPASSDATASAEAPQTQLEEAGPRIGTTAELAAFAASQRADDEPNQAATSTCATGGTFVGAVVYAGVPAEVFDDGTTVTALDATTCEVLATVER